MRIATVDRPSSPPFGTKGDRFYFDFTKAAGNPKTFDSNEINPQRDPASYVFYQGDGVFKTLGPKFVVRVTAEVLRAVFVLKNVQRVPGKAGILRRSVLPPDLWTKGGWFGKKLRCLMNFFLMTRFKEPVVTIDDIVTSSSTQVPYKTVNTAGNEEDTDWMEEVLVYKLQSGVSEKEGKIPADRWAYLDPEIGHRISVWATGLTIEVCFFPCFCLAVV